MRKAPSIKRLVSGLGITPQQAETIRRIIKGPAPTDETTEFPQTARWIRSCYNMPLPGDRRMAAIDETLGTHGVEAIFRADAGFSEAPLLTYCNAGDTYAATIVRHWGGTYAVACWGDVVESLERRGVKVA
jgi:hypothetical protein